MQRKRKNNKDVSKQNNKNINSVKTPYFRNRRRRRNRGSKMNNIQYVPGLTQAEKLYNLSLANPIKYRGVKLPTEFNTPTQVKCIHGNVTVSTSATGFCRIFFLPHYIKLSYYADATHNETVLGVVTDIINGDTDVQAGVLFRLVTGAMRLRSTASFSSESGMIQAYSVFGLSTHNYDYYRDQPHLHTYSKGQAAVVRYQPFDRSELELQDVSTSAVRSVLSKRVMGFMIKGAPNQTFDLTYAFNYEFTGNLSSDLLPHSVGLPGSPALAVQTFRNKNSANDNEHADIEELASKEVMPANIPRPVTTKSRTKFVKPNRLHRDGMGGTFSPDAGNQHIIGMTPSLI